MKTTTGTATAFSRDLNAQTLAHRSLVPTSAEKFQAGETTSRFLTGGERQTEKHFTHTRTAFQSTAYMDEQTVKNIIFVASQTAIFSTHETVFPTVQSPLWIQSVTSQNILFADEPSMVKDLVFAKTVSSAAFGNFSYIVSGKSQNRYRYVPKNAKRTFLVGSASTTEQPT